MLKLGSLFDGIGGWPLAAIKFGINPVWSSEIAPFPQEITKTHFPSMKHLGDITKINGAEIDPVDIICMGSPCQDLSIAGKREGLDGERSGLFRRAVDIVRQMRNATNGQYPRFIVWENVPGAFSSNKGNDFRTVLEEITETEIPVPTSGRWATAGMVRSKECEVAWRVMDAQYWGVPQRRKRIFLVADFRGQCAGEILFKPKSVSGDIAKGSDKRKRTAGSITDSIRKTSQSIPCIAYAIQGNMIGRTDKNGPQGNGINKEVSFTLNTIDRHAVSYVLHPRVTGTICASGAGTNRPAGQGNETELCIVQNDYRARRLTPTECERLQGLPDGYTLIDDKKCSDSARYKALGNGMSQPCPDSIMEGIASIFRSDNP